MAVGTAHLVERIWARDAGLWTGTDEDRWLGWLEEPSRMRERVAELESFASSAREAGFVDVVLAGMGGSSLAPEVIRRTFEAESFHVLDTTHPDAVRALEEELGSLDHTLFLVASKSGGTLETRSHMEYFWEKTGGRGEQFVAITDPGSGLESTARERGFRAVWDGEATIGGRYSALSVFGMVPAALMGIDLDRLLLRAHEMVEACREDEGNPGVELGERLGTGWLEGRDKVLINPNPGGFGLWAEQLIAESTGKEGKGLVPVPGENDDGSDRQFEEVRVQDPYELGQEFYRWEFATAAAGALIGINPFDQPNVQEAKDRTGEILSSGEEPRLEPESSLDELLAQAKEGDYFCLQAFVEPTPQAERTIEAVRERVRREQGIVTTAGFGPRYLHSTGQLHKGGPGSGLFLQVVDDPEELEIPGSDFGFARLIKAQAAGDFEALKERGRRVARVNWEGLG
ncbi:MAG: glucose-6-phosphate isomerase [Actinobacteria bacterium]|nr:glucose-6-phosphate isomerase [Actinomycetota bacterium]